MEENVSNQANELLDTQISVAAQELQRCISHIHQSDNNSFRLVFILLLSFIPFFVLENSKIDAIIILLQASSSTIHTVFLFAFFLGISGLLVGFVSTVFALLPHYSYRVERDSVFYFRTTAFKTSDEYAQDFRALQKEELLDDLLLQIHQYSIIANKKYRSYEWGLKCSTVCFILLVALFISAPYIL